MSWWRDQDDNAAAAQYAQLRDDILELRHLIADRFKTMSDQVAAAEATLGTAVDNLAAAVSAAAAEIKTLADRIATQASGPVISSDQLAQLNADAARIQAQADALNNAVAAAPPPPPPPAAA